MARLLDEELVSLREACSLFPGRKNLSPVMIQQWRSRGVFGICLETMLIGGRRFTSKEAIGRFLEAINAAADSQQSIEEARS